jgi:hypothetical protein
VCLSLSPSVINVASPPFTSSSLSVSVSLSLAHVLYLSHSVLHSLSPPSLTHTLSAFLAVHAKTSALSLSLTLHLCVNRKPPELCFPNHTFYIALHFLTLLGSFYGVVVIARNGRAGVLAVDKEQEGAFSVFDNGRSASSLPHCFTTQRPRCAFFVLQIWPLLGSTFCSLKKLQQAFIST